MITMMMGLLCLLGGGANGLRFVEKEAARKDSKLESESTSSEVGVQAEEQAPQEPPSEAATRSSLTRRSHGRRARKMTTDMMEEDCTNTTIFPYEVDRLECEYWQGVDMCVDQVAFQFIVEDFVGLDTPYSKDATKMYFFGMDKDKLPGKDADPSTYANKSAWELMDFTLADDHTRLYDYFDKYVNNSEFCGQHPDHLTMCDTSSIHEGPFEWELTENVFAGQNPYNSSSANYVSQICLPKGQCKCSGYDYHNYCDVVGHGFICTAEEFKKKTADAEKECNADSGCTFVCGYCMPTENSKGVTKMCSEGTWSQDSELCDKLRRQKKNIAILPAPVQDFLGKTVMRGMASSVSPFRKRTRRLKWNKNTCNSGRVSCRSRMTR